MSWRPYIFSRLPYIFDSGPYILKDHIFSKTVYFTFQDRIFYHLIRIFHMKERLVLKTWKILINLSCLKNALLSQKDCIFYLRKIEGSLILKDCVIFRNERLCNLSKLKNPAIFLIYNTQSFWERSPFFTHERLTKIFQI